jgi:tetratricopeptide (TPR) repeat protein
VAAADRQYQVGHFGEALAEYSKAYELYATPPLLFNIAQCHRGLKNWERAIFFFDGYLSARPNAENRKVVEALIAEAQTELDKQRQATVEADRAAKSRAEAEEKLRLHAEQLRIDEDQKLRIEAERQKLEDTRRFAAERKDDRLTHKWWFWSAVGSAALVAGGAAYYFSGSTTMVPPTGSLGGLDRR